MAGTKAGGLKAKETNYKLNGPNFYKTIGAKGGKAEVPKGFSMNRELASQAGAIGGTKSKRRKKNASTNNS